MLFVVGKPVLSEVIGSYIGFILIWAAFISVGVFISSVTESQVVAAILTFVELFVLYSLDGWTQEVTLPWLKTAIGWFSIFKRYNDFQLSLIHI